MSEKELLKKAVDIIRQRMPKGLKYRVFLFGSRAEGKASERSDFDIGCDYDAEDLPTGTRGEILCDLEELPVLHKVDFVDFNRAAEGFKNIARQNMRILYEC